MSKFRVGVTPDFYTDAPGLFEHVLESQLTTAGIEWAPMPAQPGKVATAEALDQFDAIFALALKFTAESVRGLKRLALVARWGVGYDMIDTKALTEAAVALGISPNGVRRPVAEAILTFILALTTQLPAKEKLLHAGEWRKGLELGRNLKGRVLGSIGCGNIAQEMFRIVQSIGFGRLIAYDPYVSPEQVKSLNVELVTMDEVFCQSDFVTINTLLNESTRGLVGEPQLRAMKPGAYLINTARGPIIQEQVLIRALRERWIAGAGLDVFETEPLPLDNPLRELDNVILTPHGLAWTEEIARDNALDACNNILAVSRGELPPALVNREVANHPAFQAKLAAFKNG
jgi:phosphoglycerate dehydrogenase-like enzyme